MSTVANNEVTGLEPPRDRGCRLTLNLTESEIDSIGAAVVETNIAGLYPAEESLAMICREWLDAKRQTAEARI